jgi:hypothetical protein
MKHPPARNGVFSETAAHPRSKHRGIALKMNSFLDKAG